ncbi:MAG: SPOR domain-containing protein [Pseudomonadota bacterium]
MAQREPVPAVEQVAPPTPVEAVTPQIELVDHAPPLQFDLEMELQRAFNGAPPSDPVPAVEAAPHPFAPFAATAAVAETAKHATISQPDMSAADAKPTDIASEHATSASAAQPGPETDLSDLIAEELDRALQEEIALDGIGGDHVRVPVASDPVLDFQDGFTEPAPAIKAATTAPMPMMKTPPAFDSTYASTSIDPSDPAAEFGATVAEADLSYPDEELRVPQVPFETKQANHGGRKAALVLLGVAMLGATAALGISLFTSNEKDGEVPVLMAEKEPAKVKPKDAGGSVVPNQDQAVYENVEGKKPEAPKQAELRDTTEKPIAVQATRVIKPKDSAPKASDRILTPKRVRTTVVRPDGTIVTDGPPAALQEIASAPVTAPVLTPSQPTGGYTAPTAEPTTTAATSAPVTKPAPTPVKVSPVKVTSVPIAPPPAPKVAPAAVPKAKAPAPKPKPVAAAPARKPAPAPKPVQTAAASPFAVQISSQRSQAAAEQSARTITGRYSSIIGGRGVDIRKAVVKGRDYYRVRIPAQSRSEANAMCSSLKSAGGDCFVTR